MLWRWQRNIKPLLATKELANFFVESTKSEMKAPQINCHLSRKCPPTREPFLHSSFSLGCLCTCIDLFHPDWIETKPIFKYLPSDNKLLNSLESLTIRFSHYSVYWFEHTTPLLKIVFMLTLPHLSSKFSTNENVNNVLHGHYAPWITSALTINFLEKCIEQVSWHVGHIVPQVIISFDS